MRFWWPVLLRMSALMVLMGATLSACVVVEEDPGYGPGPGPRPGGGFCTREYDPVCARRGGDQRTFANGCLADDSGYRIIGRGECRRGNGGGWAGGGGGGNGPRFCTQQYDPVCARRGGDRQTFSNSCLADQAGYDVVRRGECARNYSEPVITPAPQPQPQPTDVGCTREYRPVCARQGGDARSFPNECEARTAGYRVVNEGDCRSDSALQPADAVPADGRIRRQPGR